MARLPQCRSAATRQVEAEGRFEEVVYRDDHASVGIPTPSASPSKPAAAPGLIRAHGHFLTRHATLTMISSIFAENR